MATSKTAGKAPAKRPAAKAVAASPEKVPSTGHGSPSGFSIDINPDVWDDMEVLDLMVDISSGNDVRVGMAVPKLLAKIMTPEQKQALYDHVRTPDGRVPVSAITDELMVILTSQTGEQKK